MSGSGVLAVVVIAAWALVFGATQVLVDPPLPTGATLLVGGAASTALILGYPSALRGPRSGGRWRPIRERPARGRSHDGRERGPRDGPAAAFADLGRGTPLRAGLTADAAERTVRSLRPLLAGDAVAITDRDRVLAFVGPGEDHHRRGGAPVTGSTERVLATGRTAVVRDRRVLGCPESGCPLQTAVIAALRIGDRVVGALKVYRLDEVPPSRASVEGMASVLSLHLELAELDRERQLAADARLDALRAQINPHFLFNTLNTIGSKSRTDPDEARQLLLRLSDFFRYSTRQEGQFADFGQEYFFVRTYVALEQARYGDRLRVRYDVDPQVLAVQVPVLTIQPLVENAVKHGLASKIGGGTVVLRARVEPLTRMTRVVVRDDGVGMDAATLRRARSPGGSDGGVGLRNIEQRLATLFGERYALDVTSAPGEGTTVDLRVPQ